MLPPKGKRKKIVMSPTQTERASGGVTASIKISMATSLFQMGVV
jgi:hypothetical protein